MFQIPKLEELSFLVYGLGISGISVVNFLKKKKIKFIKIREPGGSLSSEKIRRLILNKKSNFNVYTDLLLYLAARSENINLIKKKL